MPGVFIAVEGPEGAGKTTLVGRLARRIEAAGWRVVNVREPGGTATSELARELVLDPAHDWTDAAELFLYLTARAELVARVIRPALAQDRTVVISDRYDLSTRAYQVVGRGLPEDAVLAANRLATGGLQPHVTLVLDLTPEAGRARQRAQGKSADRLERADPAMHQRVAEFFATAAGPGIAHLDATRPADELEERAWAVVRRSLDGTC